VAAERHRGSRQRGFTSAEVTRLVDIFGVSPLQLTTQCANCGGHPLVEAGRPTAGSA
jgi:hypothetical protein